MVCRTDGCGDRSKEGAPGPSCLHCMSPLPPSMSPVCHQDWRDGTELWVGHTHLIFARCKGSFGQRGVPWGEPALDAQGEEEEEEAEEAVLRTETCLGGNSRSVPSSPRLSPSPDGQEAGTQVLRAQRDAKSHFAAWCCSRLWCLPGNAPPAHRQPLPDPLPDAAGSSNVISLPLISRARLCAPRSPPASLAFIDSPLIWLEGEVGSNGINDGVRALLAAACDGKVTDRDPRPVLAIPAPSIGAGLGAEDLPCRWDPCIRAWHPGTHLFHHPRSDDRDLANPRLPPASSPPPRCSFRFASRAIRLGALSKLATGMGSGEVALAGYYSVPAPGLASLVRLTRAVSIPLSAVGGTRRCLEASPCPSSSLPH